MTKTEEIIQNVAKAFGYPTVMAMYVDIIKTGSKAVQIATYAEGRPRRFRATIEEIL
jgi:hypothetical protein